MIKLLLPRGPALPLLGSRHGRWLERLCRLHAEKPSRYFDATDEQFIQRKRGEQGSCADEQVCCRRSQVPWQHIKSDDHKHGLVDNVEGEDGLVGVVNHRVADVQEAHPERERREELVMLSSNCTESLQGMELLGTVSHEQRSPLAPIKGYAATLLRQDRRLGREERHQFLLAITEASDRLGVVIERLLEVSQLETGQVRIDRAPVDMARLAGEAITAIKGPVAALSPRRFVFSLRLKCADDAPADAVPLIEADQRRLREVLDNLRFR
jgi:signal transduction histidine kinase